MSTLITIVIWLLPFIIYLMVFNDNSRAKILWGVLTIAFSWVGLIGRLIYGLIAKPHGI